MGVAMTCRIERPTPQDLFNRHLEMFSTNVLGGAAVIPESNEWYAASVNYAVAEQFYAISEQAWKERDPREACCENVILMGERDGIYPLAAVFAQGYVKLTGVAGSVLPSALEFTIGGQTFVSASGVSQPNAIGTDGAATVRVRATAAGIVGNITETTGTLNTNATGVDSEVEVCGGAFCQGSDAESCEAFRARYLSRLQYQPRATNAWILDKFLEWPCVTRALQREGTCCRCNDCAETPSGCEDCGCKDCGGELAFYVMMDSSFPCGIPTTTVLNEIEEWMFGSPKGYGLGQVEIGVCGRIARVTPIPVDIFLDIVDCVSTTKITQLEDTIQEFFSTVEPSKPIQIRSLNAFIGTILGQNVDYEVSIRLTNASDRINVYEGNCDIEPNCDFMLCLNSINIGRTSTSGVSCG